MLGWRTTVKMSGSIRNLGAIIDEHCHMEQHATKVCTAANYHLHCIRKIRKCINRDNCRILVHSQVTSRLDYGNPLLYNAPKKLIARLERVQRSAARVICCIDKRSHISMTEVLHDLHWLPVSLRIRYKILVIAFKAFHTGTPQYLADLLIRHTPARSLRSQSKSNIMVQPKYKLVRSGATSFSIGAPHLWNALPETLRNITCLDIFKKQLKTHLFRTNYYEPLQHPKHV